MWGGGVGGDGGGGQGPAVSLAWLCQPGALTTGATPGIEQRSLLFSKNAPYYHKFPAIKASTGVAQTKAFEISPPRNNHHKDLGNSILDVREYTMEGEEGRWWVD